MSPFDLLILVILGTTSSSLGHTGMWNIKFPPLKLGFRYLQNESGLAQQGIHLFLLSFLSLGWIRKSKSCLSLEGLSFEGPVAKCGKEFCKTWCGNCHCILPSFTVIPTRGTKYGTGLCWPMTNLHETGKRKLVVEGSLRWSFRLRKALEHLWQVWSPC